MEKREYTNFLLGKYEVLLFSLLLLMFGNLISPPGLKEVFQALFLIVNIAVGLAVFKFGKALKVIISTILIATILIECYHFCTSSELRPLSMGLYILYFLILSTKLYQTIYFTKTAERNLIIAAFCGFIMLGLLTSFVFIIVESVQPGSFSNIGTTTDMKYPNIQYFSFVTILTIGYGDILPSTDTAKQLTVFFGLLGNFYTVIVTGIIIGKYLNNK